MRRRTQGDESEPLLSSMEQTPPTKEKLDATTDDAVIIPVDDEDADLDAPYVRRRSSRRSSVDVEAPSGAAAEGVV